MNKLPGGMWPVMITPLTSEGNIDLPALEELVNFYIENGSNGLFANCLSSEMFNLSPDERILVTQKTVEFAKGRVPVISTGTFSSDEEINADFFKKIYATGVKAVVINSNQLNPETDDDEAFKQKLEKLLEVTGEIPVGIYECPVPYKRLLSPEIMKWMAETNRFFYFKDTSCDNDQINAKLDQTKGSTLGFYNANIPTGLSSMQYGADGLSPIGANYFPELYSYLANNYNDKAKADKIKKVNTFLSIIDPLIHSCYPLSAKWFLQKRGLSLTTTTRTQYTEPTSQDFIKLNDLFDAFQDLKTLINP